MKIISFNANGIRSAAQKGFYHWLEQQNADIVCIQETKAQYAQLSSDPVFSPLGYHTVYVDAEKKGYSGVAIYAREKPEHIVRSLGFPLSDAEGRYVQFDFSDFSVASIYLPSGTSGSDRQTLKFEFLERFLTHLEQLCTSDRQWILCGDYNIAHRPIDIKNWRSNQKNSGFLPEERAWFDHIFDKLGFVDAFRQVNDSADEYTWWSNRGQARAKNVGWRIDYQIVTSGLRDKIRAASVYRETFFSDHAPLIIEYEGKARV